MKADLEGKGADLPDVQAGSPRPRSLRGYFMLGLAFLTCPCHLPILLLVLAGTAAGVSLRENLALTGVALTAIFLASLWLGLRWMGSGVSRRGK